MRSTHPGRGRIVRAAPHVQEVTLPEANSAAVEFLLQRKYTEQRRVLRMRRGPALPWRPEMVWGRIGNNLG